ncbi:MAG TPA: transglutaminase family protein [Steroidobacteraceae bacterium]|jgi:transglutaminase-like putative cysteine protease
MRYAVEHSTVYEYGGDVAHSHHLLHLRPRESAFQRCPEHTLNLDPEPSWMQEGADAFGNPIVRLEYDRSHDRLVVTSELQIEVLARSLDSPESAQPWEAVGNRLSYHAVELAPLDLDACRFRMQSDHVPLKQAFVDYAQDCFAPRRSLFAAAADLQSKIHRDFKYLPGSTTNRTSIVEVLEKRRGVCQDFAHLMIGCLRSRGLAARYVSGYIRTVRKDGEAAVGGDASHAWVSVYCPPIGWVDFDPTNDCLVGEDHVTLAWGRDFGDVSPLRGMIVGGGRHKLKVDVRVQPIS